MSEATGILSGRRAVATGGAGTGRAISLALAAAGAAVAVTDLQPGSAARTWFDRRGPARDDQHRVTEG